jgi:hypothetical protein
MRFACRPVIHFDDEAASRGKRQPLGRLFAQHARVGYGKKVTVTA